MKAFQAKNKEEYFDENRIGDHICYYSDLTKIKDHTFQKFEIEHSLKDTIQQIVEALRPFENSKHWHLKNQYFTTETPHPTPNGFGVTLLATFKNIDHRVLYTDASFKSHEDNGAYMP